MGRIRILPDQVANKIAAGEVVERPASVVKELLENSLDAGAAEIRVDVEAGGRRLIRIVDDGCGMLRDDALLAFERHATSKLRDVKDLLSIATLGFRGEALPSIASVSRLLLETRSPEETTGTRIEIAGGKMLRCEEAALGGGTAITVRDLFYNVPARRKFLRTEQTELAHIASLVTHYSLAHPDKTFLLTSGLGTAARHARGHLERARLPGVRQPGAGGPGGDRRARKAVVHSGAQRAAFRSHRRIPARRGRRAGTRARIPHLRLLLAAAGAEGQPQFHFHFRERPPDPRPPAAARALFGLSQPDAGVGVPVRAAVPGMRCRRGGRERAPFEDRGALPPRLVRARFRPRHHPRAPHGEPPGALVFALHAQRRR